MGECDVCCMVAEAAATLLGKAPCSVDGTSSIWHSNELTDIVLKLQRWKERQEREAEWSLPSSPSCDSDPPDERNVGLSGCEDDCASPSSPGTLLGRDEEVSEPSSSSCLWVVSPRSHRFPLLGQYRFATSAADITRNTNKQQVPTSEDELSPTSSSCPAQWQALIRSGSELMSSKGQQHNGGRPDLLHVAARLARGCPMVDLEGAQMGQGEGRVVYVNIRLEETGEIVAQWEATGMLQQVLVSRVAPLDPPASLALALISPHTHSRTALLSCRMPGKSIQLRDSNWEWNQEKLFLLWTKGLPQLLELAAGLRERTRAEVIGRQG
eukprot:jgi/Chlat1/1002/Chrsp108S01410